MNTPNPADDILRDFGIPTTGPTPRRSGVISLPNASPHNLDRGGKSRRYKSRKASSKARKASRKARKARKASRKARKASRA